MAVLFVDSGDGLHIASSLHNDNSDVFVGVCVCVCVCVTGVTVNITKIGEKRKLIIVNRGDWGRFLLNTPVSSQRNLSS